MTDNDPREDTEPIPTEEVKALKKEIKELQDSLHAEQEYRRAFEKRVEQDKSLLHTRATAAENYIQHLLMQIKALEAKR